MSDTVVHSANELVVGPDETGIESIENGAIVLDESGHITAVGQSETLCSEYPPENANREIDASGQCVVPGFVDSHTHALFAGDRSDEFAATIQGTSYQELLASGGAIHRTVRATRAASNDALLERLLERLDTLLANGTTTVEVKTGYGLDTETECRMLEVIARADDLHPIDVVATFLGAHAVPTDADSPEGSTAGSAVPPADTEAYVEAVIEEQLPAVADLEIATFCDVFCEDGAFDAEQSRRILEAGIEHGLTPKIHAEELSHSGGAALASDLEAASADHLLCATQDDIRALGNAGVTPVLLPATAFALDESYADARAFLDAGLPVALATDFNPNCYTQSQSFVCTLACVGMGMTPAEALLGVTAHSADALSLPAGHGTLETGTTGDLLVLDIPTHVHLPYRFDGTPVEKVLKDGAVVHDSTGEFDD